MVENSSWSIFLYGLIGASVMAEKRTPIKKSNMKSLAILKSRRYPISYQDNIMLGIVKDKIIPPLWPKCFPRYKLLINKADDDRIDSINTDTSRNDKNIL